MRECYVTASCSSKRKVKWFPGRMSWFLYFCFKLYSIFGKPEHLDFASLLAKGKKEKKKGKRGNLMWQFLVFISIYFKTCYSSKEMTVTKRILHVGAGTLSRYCRKRCSCEGLCMQNSSSLHVVLHKALTNQKYYLCPCSFLASSSCVDVPDLVFGVSKIWTSPWWSTVYLWALTYVLNDSL